MIMKNDSILNRLSLVFAVLLCICIAKSSIVFAAPEAATEKEIAKTPSVEKVGENVVELLAHIRTQADKAKAYQKALEKASTEDREVVQLQLALLQDNLLKEVHQLSDALLALEKKGEQPELRQEVTLVMTRTAQRLWNLTAQLRIKIDKERARRTSAAVAEQPEIENNVAKLTQRLNQIYTMSYDHLQKMKAMGMDTASAQKTLTESLISRADELHGRILLAVQRIEELELHLKDIPDDADTAKLLISATKSLNTNTTAMSTVLGLLENHEQDTKVYRTQLVEVTQDISSGLTSTGLTSTDVAFSLVSHYSEKVTNWLVDHGPTVLFKLLFFCAILVLFNFIRRMVRSGLEKAFSKSKVKLTELARRMVVSTISNIVMIFGLLIALSQFGISLGPLLAGLGVAGFIIGFALQETLGNFAAGIMILIYRPYDVGDLIDVSGAYGKVYKMNLVSTTIATLDNQLIVVPNNKIWGDVIKNVTAQELRRVDMIFGISYSDDIDKAEAILNDILTKHDKTLDEPAPMVRLHTLGESSVDFIVRPWVKAADYWDVYWDVTKAVKKRFDAEGVSIPFPQRDVHLYGTDPQK